MLEIFPAVALTCLLAVFPSRGAARPTSGAEAETLHSDSVAAVLAESRTVNTVQERLQADIIVSLSLIPVRDSLVRLVQVRDLTSPMGQSTRVLSVPTAQADPTGGVEKVVRETFRLLAEMDRTAREMMRARAVSPGTPAPPSPPAIARP